MRIAFVGLGNMGLPMATHLRDAGHDVVGVDVDAERAAAFEARGGRTASARAAADGAEVLVTMLRTPDQALAASATALEAMTAGGVYVDASTVGPATAESLADRAADAGVGFVDAPVSGGVTGAEDATLAVMAGGEDADVERVRPLLDAVGEDVFHVGPVGAGQAAKLCNQLLVNAHLLSVAEAFRLGDSADIDQETLYDVLTSCIGTSGILEQKGRRIIEGDYDPGADVNLQHKDTQLILEEAAAADLPVHLTAAVAQQFVRARQAGLGDRDHIVLYELLGDG
ncbi:MAG: NAD(P)-dependent oxidoreductase [Halobacteriaceae archaeon]